MICWLAAWPRGTCPRLGRGRWGCSLRRLHRRCWCPPTACEPGPRWAPQARSGRQTESPVRECCAVPDVSAIALTMVAALCTAASQEANHTTRPHGVSDWTDLGEGAVEGAPNRSGCRLY